MDSAPATSDERFAGLVAAVEDALTGSYGPAGIARWWRRPRPELGGRSPAQTLTEAGGPLDPGPQRVLELARALEDGPAGGGNRRR